jgi:hypothetical protein
MWLGNGYTIPMSIRPIGGGVVPPIGDFIALESGLTNIMALESGLTDLVELE